MRIPVLAVDDDRLVHAVLRVMFRRWNDLALDLAEDGKDALEKLAIRRYQLVISDVQMPQLDGLGLLEEIRHRFPDLPVIMLSGTRDAAVPVRAFGLGALEYLEKPVHARDLRSVIDSAIPGARAQAMGEPRPAVPAV